MESLVEGAGRTMWDAGIPEKLPFMYPTRMLALPVIFEDVVSKPESVDDTATSCRW